MGKIDDGKKQVLHKEVLRHRQRIPLRWQQFAKEYLVSGFKNASKAYRKVYGEGVMNSDVGAAKLLAKQQFQEFFAKYLEKQLNDDKAIVSAKVVQTYMLRAFYEISDIITDSGELKGSLEELDAKGLSCVVDGTEKFTDKNGNEHIRVKLADRDVALEALAKYLKLIQQGSQVNVEAGTQKHYQLTIIRRMTPAEWDIYYEQKMQKENRE